MYRNRLGRKRLFIQLMAAAFFNGYAKGFAGGTIFAGKSKGVCVPVLNCYSCPGAIGACPIGSLQAIVGQQRMPFYVLGSMMLFGIVFGRILCGFLCPFGLIQDLLHKIPSSKVRVPQRIHRVMCLVKYFVLAFLVLLLPMWVAISKGVAVPFFCKFLCPAGTLEGGLLLGLLNKKLRGLMGALFGWKLAILCVVVVASIVIPRPFCRYFCPLGAFYGFFHKLSFFQLEMDKKRCVDCGKCEQVCPMQVDITAQIQSPECIHCGACKEVCPVGAIHDGWNVEKKRV